MLEKLLFLLSSSYFGSSPFKTKLMDKTENGNVQYSKYQPGTLMPPSPPQVSLFPTISELSSEALILTHRASLPLPLSHNVSYGIPSISSSYKLQERFGAQFQG